MSFSTNVPFSTKILPLSLESYFNQHQISDFLPVYLVLSDNALTLNEKQSKKVTVDSTNQELVVFSDLSMTNLLALQNTSHININALTTINTRNQQTSYRFSITCTDFIKARKSIADFALAQGIEAALIQDAPTLTEPGLLVMDMDSTTIEIECIG